MADCNCTLCRLRRLSGGLLLILAGVLLLLGMLRPQWEPAMLVGVFLVISGAWRLLLNLLSGDAAHGPAPAVFPALLMLAVGGLILGHHFFPALPWGAEISRYWPVFLILWGLTRLTQQASGRRRGLSAGDVVLLLGIVIGGLAFSGAYRVGRSHIAARFGINMPAWNPFLTPHQFQTAVHTALPLRTPVLVQGGLVSVRLVPGAPGELSATISDTVTAANEDAARATFQRNQPAFLSRDGELVFKPSGEGDDISAHVVVTLPPSTPVQVDLDGQVQAQDWQAPLQIRSGGSVVVGHTDGDVRIATRWGDVSCDHVSGTVHITGSGSDVSVAETTGPVVVDGSFTGKLSFRALAQGLRLHTRQTTLSVAALPGTLSGDLGHVDLDGASAVIIATRDAALNLTHVSGPLDLRTRNRPVEVDSNAVSAPILIRDENADVTLRLPAGSTFHLEARARNGHILADDFALPVRVQNHNATANGDTPGPARSALPDVHLDTTNGTITLTRSSEETARL